MESKGPISRDLADAARPRKRGWRSEEAGLCVNTYEHGIPFPVLTVDFLMKNRRTVLAVLLLPAVAVVVALALIAILRPARLLLIVLAVGVVLAQYMLLVLHIWRRIKMQPRVA